MIKAIITQVKPAFFCGKCLKTSQILYINGRFRYCDECCPTEIREKAVYFNQNGEQIEYKE